MKKNKIIFWKFYHYHILTSLSLAIIVTVVASCQPQQKEDQASTETTDTVARQNIKPPESGYADVNGLKMYYEVYGNGKPIVLLHGSYMNIPLNWSHIIPLLSKDRKVIVTEMQGHGRTRDISREFSYEGMADDVSGLLKHLKIDSADILGYSMGGGVAFQVAVRHPEQVRRLVVLSGVYTHDGWWPMQRLILLLSPQICLKAQSYKNNTTVLGTIRPISRNL